MPRKADKQLEGRIVDAAYQLWSKGGERGNDAGGSAGREDDDPNAL